MLRAGEIFKARSCLTVLVFGPSGTGKTTWSAKAPMPYHLLCEQQGLESIAVTNPNSLVHMVQSYPDFLEKMEAIKRGVPCLYEKQPAYKFKSGDTTVVCQTVVIDSITEVNEMALEHHGKGKAKLSFDVWNLVQKDMKHILSDLRSLPINIICLALQGSETDDEGAVIQYTPEMYGKAKSFAPRYFSAVGVSAKVRTKKATKYMIGWDAKGKYVSKRPPVPESIDFPSATTASLGSILMTIYPDGNTPHRAVDKPGNLDA